MAVKIYEAQCDTFIACPFQKWLKKGDHLAIEPKIERVIVLGYGKNLKYVSDHSMDIETLGQVIQEIPEQRQVFTDTIQNKSMAKRKKVKTK
jgi:hypothetical protein